MVEPVSFNFRVFTVMSLILILRPFRVCSALHLFKNALFIKCKNE